MKKIILNIINFYQLLVSPLFGKNCRFYPSCSDYFAVSVQKHGAFNGAGKGILRIFRCHPFSKGGIDLP
ncbi:MAG: membrane protein insertion efficiency factor YidD [Candidatus Nealsonbacteria bacterium]